MGRGLVTPIGELSSALIAGGHAPHIFEVFVHPFTAGETIAQSKLGALRINGQPATAEVVDELGNGDYILRLYLERSRMIHPTAVIGSPPEHRDWKPGDPICAPEIAETARVNAFVTVDGGLREPTRIGDGAFVMAHCHVGHDAQIGAGCELAPGTVIGGHVILEERVRCGIGVLIRPFIRVGAGARLGAGAVVVKDVPAGEVWVGNPARPLAPKVLAADELTELEQAGWEQLAGAMR